MSGYHVHGYAGHPAPEPFYSEQGPCCWQAANTEGDDCSCWLPILHPAPAMDNGQLVTEEGPQELRRSKCGDCAYRPSSPERAAQGGEPLTYGLDRPFSCHEADRDVDPDARMPRVTVWVHPPSGATLTVTDDDYKPVINGNRPYLATGAPAPLCAGWADSNRLNPTRKATR